MAKKKIKNPSLLTAIIIFIIMLLKIYVNPNVENNTTSPIDDNNSNITNINMYSNSNLKVHYIDVGQADSILITLNDASMLIDAGNNDDGGLVVNYLKKQNISSLDYVIGTHPHEDHIGGLDDVIKNFEIKKVIMPEVQNNTKTFEDVLDAISFKNLKITTPNIGDTYSLSDAKFTILSCKNGNVEELNTASIVIRLEYKTQSYLFCADAEKENEYEMMESNLTLKSNVIKIGHHGSTTSSLEKFITTVDPEIAIISVGSDNEYGHPHEKITNRLNRLGITTYRTDINGTIVIVSDGNTNKVILEKEDNE